MAKTSRWYSWAAATITRVQREAEAQGLDAEATRRLVDAAYPFGPREHWPYRQWLKARRELLGLPGSVSAGDQGKLAAWQEGAPLRVEPGPPSALEEYLQQQGEP
jgi:hypothetical protein